MQRSTGFWMAAVGEGRERGMFFFPDMPWACKIHRHLISPTASCLRLPR